MVIRFGIIGYCTEYHKGLVGDNCTVALSFCEIWTCHCQWGFTLSTACFLTWGH